MTQNANPNPPRQWGRSAGWLRRFWWIPVAILAGMVTWLGISYVGNDDNDQFAEDQQQAMVADSTGGPQQPATQQAPAQPTRSLWRPSTWFSSSQPAASAATPSGRQAQTPQQPKAGGTMTVEKKELYSIGDVGGNQRYYLKFADADGREFRFEGGWVSAASAAVFRGDKIQIIHTAENDSFTVLDRTKPVIPKGPVFLRCLEGDVQYHPSTMGSRGVTVTFVADYPMDVTMPEIAEQVRVQVIGVDEPGFTNFLENVEATGAWVTLNPVVMGGKGNTVETCDKFAAGARAQWNHGPAPLSYPRMVDDDMGRRVIQTIWPAGISVTSLRRYRFEGFPRAPAQGVIRPDKIVNPGDVGSANAARMFRKQPVHEAISIKERLEKQAVAQKAAQKKAVAAKKQQAAADSANIKAALHAKARDDSLVNASRERQEAAARQEAERLQKEQQEADERAAAVRQDLSRFRNMLNADELMPDEAQELAEVSGRLRNSSLEDRPATGWPSEKNFNRAEKLIRKYGK